MWKWMAGIGAALVAVVQNAQRTGGIALLIPILRIIKQETIKAGT